MGEMGWTYDQTLDTPMSKIAVAHRGRIKLIEQILKAVFGDGRPGQPKVSKTPMTPALFDNLFGGKT